MSDPNPPERIKRPTSSSLPPRSRLGFAVAVAAVVVICGLSYSALEVRTEAGSRVTHAFGTMQQVDVVLSILRDAESGQRGYLLTGEESYLEPYERARGAIRGEIAVLRRMLETEPRQVERVDRLASTAENKLVELERTVELRRSGNNEAALRVVNTDQGRIAMEVARTLLGAIADDELRNLDASNQAWRQASIASLWVTFGSSGVLLLLIAFAAMLSSRDFRLRETEVWLRRQQLALGAEMQGEQRLDQLGAGVLRVLAGALGAHVGAIYIAEMNGSLRRFATHALPDPENAKPVVLPRDGLAGEAVNAQRTIHVKDVPQGYLPITSALGAGDPRNLLICPAVVDGTAFAVVELGFLRTVEPIDLELLDRVRESIAIAVRSSRDRTLLEQLLEETQRQGEELVTQQEELKVSNEELEEQGEALRAYQGRLETQQTDLEQTNTQLEEQTQVLESQRDELLRAQSALVEKAAELARTNRFKSEFLANMSHELRTPLNSSLILAQLLSENRDGNLTDEQVKFARSIHSAGTDLLALINDILDLSKIEAGRLDIEPVTVPIARVTESLLGTFEPVAREKRLVFTVLAGEDAPLAIETDPGRLDQILKNLVSNALKFTEHGEVSVRISAAPGGRVAFEVKDTGIGVEPENIEVIFEAFRQADGSTHRKYGGTGLGLSISRELARLLGGEIIVESRPGAGSTFTLVLPTIYVALAAAPRREAPSREASAPPPKPSSMPPAPGRPPTRPEPDSGVPDHEPGKRVVLVVEDDVRFAEILCDLARQHQFECIVTHTADDGLTAALKHVPSAILLDVNLPDHTGLTVLDRLKRTPSTRHIPVHMVSVEDHSRTALELGAVGYQLKPVRREELAEAFRKLEARLDREARAVLIVEDDETQRAAICRLLESHGVALTAVATAGEALEKLRTTTFDCMVLDLTLPDLSGYELLEQMASNEGISFPPVIVYTGRSLSRDEEQRLGKYSSSIIIKDARSPERLLDEVTLFLHQVEADLPPERQKMLRAARHREAVFEGRRILIVEDDVRNVFALSSVLEPKGASVEIARNGREALETLDRSASNGGVDLVLMDIMMPEMDGLTAMRQIRSRPEWQKLPIIALTAKAMSDDREQCFAAGANDYASKPLDVEKLLSLVRVWLPRR